MKIKRFIGTDSQEAMMKVRAELGIEAVILHTRKIKKHGLMGFFQKPLVEVVAAIDDVQDSRPTEKAVDSKTISDKKVSQTDSMVNTLKFNELQGQLDSIQDMIISIANKDEIVKPSNTIMFNKYQKLLEDNDVETNIAIKILSIVQRQINFTPDNEDAIKKAIRIIMKGYLEPQNSTNSKIEKAPEIIILVGPTGVGKTTTLAKLAAKYSINDNKSVGLITADTYRIAAAEQLRTYSEILNIPLKVIYDPEEIDEAIKVFSDKEVILVDTAGRNHRKAEQLEEIKTIISNITNPQIFLVISATTTYKDIKNIVQSYSFIKDYKLIFTKLDESTSSGNILNTKVFTGKDLAYFTTGQIVPDDIELAKPEKIVDLIVGE